jgi:hypothetical protein
MIRSNHVINKIFMTGLFSALLFTVSHAQRVGNVGLGAQFGRPSGITLKIHSGGAMAVDIFAAWDLDDFFFINVHGLWETPIGSSPVNVFYGPGAFIGVSDHYRDRPFRRRYDEVLAGISGTIGINYYIQRFEIFLQLTPRLALIERTEGDFGGGIGFRFYF